MQKRSNKRKNTKKNPKTLKLRANLPAIDYTSFTDYGQVITNATTSVVSSSMLTSLIAILQAYPQHATPTYQQGPGLILRQKIRVSHLELRIQIVGAQSTTLLSGDLYNSVRYALYISGKNFSTGSTPYLTSLNGNGTVNDVQKMLLDETVSLPSQAFDSVNSYNVPQVYNKFYKIPVNTDFNFYSLTPLGTGSWDTEAFDLVTDYVSDSSVTPHPTVMWSLRTFFKFVQ